MWWDRCLRRSAQAYPMIQRTPPQEGPLDPSSNAFEAIQGEAPPDEATTEALLEAERPAPEEQQGQGRRPGNDLDPVELRSSPARFYESLLGTSQDRPSARTTL